MSSPVSQARAPAPGLPRARLEPETPDPLPHPVDAHPGETSFLLAAGVHRLESVQPKQGKILSLIIKPAPGASQARFAETTARVIELLEKSAGHPLG